MKMVRRIIRASGTGCHPTDPPLSLADSTSNALTRTRQPRSNRGTGELGGAATFVSASSTYLDFGNVLNIGLNNWTVSTWIKTSQTGTSIIGLICKTLYGVAINRWWMEMNNGLDDIEITVQSQSGSPYFSTAAVGASNILYQDGAWHRLSGVWNRTGVMSLYIDGVQVGTQPNISAYSSANWHHDLQSLFWCLQQQCRYRSPGRDLLQRPAR